jgi:hypothetical protein
MRFEVSDSSPNVPVKMRTEVDDAGDFCVYANDELLFWIDHRTGKMELDYKFTTQIAELVGAGFHFTGHYLTAVGDDEAA